MGGVVRRDVFGDGLFSFLFSLSLGGGRGGGSYRLHFSYIWGCIEESSSSFSLCCSCCYRYWGEGEVQTRPLQHFISFFFLHKSYF